MKNASESAGQQEDFLLFTDGQGTYALPSRQVQEILYPHPVTPIPFVPSCIDGLVNIEGTIAVQADMAHLSGAGHISRGRELILVETGRSLCALKVDAVLSRLSVAANAVRWFRGGEEASLGVGVDGIERELFAGEMSEGGQTVFILDVARIGRLVQAGEVRDEGAGLLGKVDDRKDLEEQEHIDCLVVQCGGERYAFELAGIMEIVEAGTCTPIPGAPDYVDGFFLLREEALLVINLLAIIDRQRAGRREEGWIVVFEREGIRYGFVVDAIEGIQHFLLSTYQPVLDAHSNLSGLFVSDERTTMLLSPERIVNDSIHAALSRYAAYHAGDGELMAEQTERYLQVAIREGRYAIPIDRVRRVTRFFPMEKTHDTSGRIRGAIDLDGRIIPVLALQYGLTLDREVDDGEYVIVSHGEDEWAICVDMANRIVDIPVSQISRLAQAESRFVNGIAHVEEQLVSLLDFSRLAEQGGNEQRTS